MNLQLSIYYIIYFRDTICVQAWKCNKNKYKNNLSIALKRINDLKKGDYVTHIDHGIGQYLGLQKIEVDGKIPIQRSHIVKYVVDNMTTVAREITRQYGLTPQVNTKEVCSIDGGEYEIVQISSIGGACWVVNRLDKLDTPRYFTSRQELEKFKQGWMS